MGPCPEASWRSGYAEDCKSLYGGSIPSEASRFPRGLSPTMAALFRSLLGRAPGDVIEVDFSTLPKV